MKTNAYSKIKAAAQSTGNDSMLGATVRRILQEELAMEALEVYNYDTNPKQYTIDQMISEVEHENRDTEHPNL